MLSLGKIQLSGESYYLNAVADGIDEYYRGVGEAPGRWVGTASHDLDLDGEVEASDLHAIWAGENPATAERMGRFPNRKVAGFDLTFRAPKSVSLLAGLGDPDTAQIVRESHEAAVDAAFAYIEREAARSRTGKNGVNQVEVNGLVAAAFRHRTSRAGDPHLHTHVLVANMAEGADGDWRTLDARWLYLHASTAGYLYEAHLRQELTARLGVKWGPIKEGIADVVGIDDDVRDHYSDRRREIEEHLDDVGFRTARAAQLATLTTRKAKKVTLDEGSMRDVWEAKAAEIGWDPADLALALDRVPRAVVETDIEALADDLMSADGLTKQASTFDRRDVLRGICNRLPAGATVADVEAMADQVLDRTGVVRLVETNGPGLLASNVIRRTDGTIVAATGIGDVRWSTAELIGIERHVVGRSTARADEGTAIVPDDVLAEMMERRPTLTAEQAEMVTRLCTSGNGIDVVCAAAGTGKTYTLDAAREAWEASGHRVIGAALAGIAAQELHSTAAIESMTLAMLQINLDAHRIRLDDRTVVVIDEAGMAGTRNLAPILNAADEAGAKVVLVGDPHQLPEIDAGGVLTGLAKRLDPIELTENRRQRAQWERDALEELRWGDVDSAFAAYRDNDRVVQAPTAIDVRRAMVADWWSHRLAGDTVAMTAYRRNDVDDLNGRARAYLVRSGDVSGPEPVLDDRPYQAGDQIVCLRNNRRLGVCNGTRATVDDVDPDRGTLTITLDERRVLLPRDYLDEGNIAHGYATTIHKTQGATVDRGLVLGTDELFRERGYVALSRGRITNHLYLIGASEIDDSTGHGPPPLTDDPVEAVQATLHRQGDKRLAIDTGEPLAFWPIEDLVAEKQRLAAVLAASPPDRSHDLTALSTRREELQGEIEPLVYRYNELADRKLRGPGTRSEMRDLRDQIGERSRGLDRLTTELDDACSGMSEREQFQTDHAHEAGFLDAVDHELDRQLRSRAWRTAAAPSDYHLHILGPVPTDPEHQATWLRGATILDRHYLGIDRDPAQRDRSSLLGGPREKAEMMARLEVMAIPREREPVQRTIEQDLGLDLFG
ncbi:MAG: relaxase domain-containing protein [Acidimicrobiales bacterium]|nr:relaxase domain-containing protein [Acidimicrobiales bacterium]